MEQEHGVFFYCTRTKNVLSRHKRFSILPFVSGFPVCRLIVATSPSPANRNYMGLPRSTRIVYICLLIFCHEPDVTLYTKEGVGNLTIFSWWSYMNEPFSDNEALFRSTGPSRSCSGNFGRSNIFWIVKNIGTMLRTSILFQADIRRKGMRSHVLFAHGCALGRIQTAL